MEVTNLLKHLICDKLVVRFHINSKIVILMVLIREKKNSRQDNVNREA